MDFLRIFPQMQMRLWLNLHYLTQRIRCDKINKLMAMKEIKIKGMVISLLSLHYHRLHRLLNLKIKLSNHKFLWKIINFFVNKVFTLINKAIVKDVSKYVNLVTCIKIFVCNVLKDTKNTDGNVSNQKISISELNWLQ